MCAGVAGIELKHLCLEYMTPWLRNLVRFCKHNDDAKRQRVTAILDKLITMTINEKQMYPSIQAKIWGSLGQVGFPPCALAQTFTHVLQNLKSQGLYTYMASLKTCLGYTRARNLTFFPPAFIDIRLARCGVG